MTLSFPAFAKVNLDLRILGVRPDGYHDLRTVFQSLALADTVTVRRDRGPLHLTCDDPQVPTDRRNLAWKAASLLWREARLGRGEPRDVAIHLQKRIPAEAGLGGGSADAAVTLLGLNRLWKLGLDGASLSRLGARIGADVPFFLVGGTALGLGRGDDIYPLADMPKVYVVLIRPGFGVSTVEAYRWYDEDARRPRRTPAAKPMPPTWPAWASTLRNELEPSGGPAPPHHCPDPADADRCRRGHGGDVRLGVGGVRPVRTGRGGPADGPGPGTARVAGGGDADPESLRISASRPILRTPRGSGVGRHGTRSPRLPKPGRPYTIWVCPGVLGRGQAVRRGSLEPVFEGSNPSAPTSFIMRPSGFGDLKVFSGSAHPQLAAEIAEFLGCGLGQARLRRFPDTEVSFQIDENIRGTDVFIIQPTCAPVDQHLMELMIMVDAFRRSSAARITAVVPYYGYARQDRKDKPRVPISAKLVANVLSASGTHRVLTMDLHKAQIQGFFDIPVDHLFAAPVIIDYLSRQDYAKLTIVAPDAGGAERARAYAKRLGAELAIVDKRRSDDGTAEVMNVIGEVGGRTCVIADDIIDTAGTIQKGAQALKDAGAERVHRLCACTACCRGRRSIASRRRRSTS